MPCSNFKLPHNFDMQLSQLLCIFSSPSSHLILQHSLHLATWLMAWTVLLTPGEKRQSEFLIFSQLPLCFRLHRPVFTFAELRGFAALVCDYLISPDCCCHCICHSVSFIRLPILFFPPHVYTHILSLAPLCQTPHLRTCTENTDIIGSPLTKASCHYLLLWPCCHMHCTPSNVIIRKD